MARTIIGETKMEGQKKAKTQIALGTKEKRGIELVPPMVGNYLTHGPSNVTYMQIVKFNNNGRSRTHITRQHNLPLYNRGSSS
jgi:hypothetical protein